MTMLKSIIKGFTSVMLVTTLLAFPNSSAASPETDRWAKILSDQSVAGNVVIVCRHYGYVPGKYANVSADDTARLLIEAAKSMDIPVDALISVYIKQDLEMFQAIMKASKQDCANYAEKNPERLELP